MGLKEQFNKLIGKQPEAISDRERWRRAVVRTGNLDHSGKPIDRAAGGPISARPEQSRYRERVSELLERGGVKIERRNTHIPEMIPNQIFNEEAENAEQTHERRFDDVNRGNAGSKEMQDYLRDGCVKPPTKRESDA